MNSNVNSESGIVHETDKALYIEGLPDEISDNYTKSNGYRLVGGNPLTQKIEWEITATWIKINDFAVHSDLMSIMEYRSTIRVEQNHEGGGANIILEKQSKKGDLE